GIIRAHREAHPVPTGQDEAALNRLTLAIDLLIYRRTGLPKVAGGGAQEQVTLHIERHAVNRIESERDRARASAWGDDEVVLQPVVLAVVRQIDTWIHVLILSCSSCHPAPG